MRAKEFVTEGPLDYLKSAGQAVAGAVQGVKTGWTAQQAANKFNNNVKFTANEAFKDWSGVMSSLDIANMTSEQISAELVNFSNRAFGDKVHNSQIPAPRLNSVTDRNAMANYLKARSAEYWRAHAAQGRSATNPVTGLRGPIAAPTAPTAPTATAPTATAPTAPTATAPTAPTKQRKEPTIPPAEAPTKYRSPDDVVTAIIKTVPANWLPDITAKLLARQRVQATPK